MRVLLVLADNMYLTPYLKLYIDILIENGVEYHIIYWDKNRNENIENNCTTVFSVKTDGIIAKIFGYFRFRKEVIKLIKNKKIDFVIPLHSVVCFILQDVLCRKYDNNFIFDVRDYSYEKYWIIRRVEKRLVAHSRMNVISSPGYKNFLPKAKYYTIHNLPAIDKRVNATRKNYKGKIVISYIGLIRFIEQNKRIINFFANDERFVLRFFGTKSDELKEFCEKNGIHNVETKGTFRSDETIQYYEDTDFVMNLYGNHTPLLDYALSNKLYYSAIMHKPILVCRDTYMENVSTKWGFGFVLDLENQKEKDDLIAFYKNLNQEKLVSSCNAFIDNIKREQEETILKLKEVLAKNKETCYESTWKEL